MDSPLIKLYSRQSISDCDGVFSQALAWSIGKEAICLGCKIRFEEEVEAMLGRKVGEAKRGRPLTLQIKQIKGADPFIPSVYPTNISSLTDHGRFDPNTLRHPVRLRSAQKKNKGTQPGRERAQL